MATLPQHQTAPGKLLSTPRKAPRMTQQGAATLKLNEQRLHLKASSSGNTVEVPVELYLSHYASLLGSQAITNDLISYVKAGLEASKALTSAGWDSTNIIGPTEDSVFKGLEDVAEDIYDLCLQWNETKQHPKLKKRTTRLICRPNHTTSSEVLGGSMRTDARFILLEEDGKGIDSEHVPTSAVAAPAEFKTRLTAKLRIDNESKALGAVSHIFYADPCRRSVMAFTIEDNFMRFWYFSRSHITVSAAFDYHANPTLFIRFVIFMTFASLEDLGYDPTVKRIHVSEKEIQYRFNIGDKVYQTIRIIHELNLDIVTRATRVWEVVELDAEDMPIGKSQVLKDVWLYFDAKPESTIYNEIFAALRRLDEDGSVPESERPPPIKPGSSLEEDARNYFMTIISDSVVTVNGRPDEAQEPPAGYIEYFYTTEDDDEQVAMPAAVVGAQRGDVDGCTPKPKTNKASVYPHKARLHRRVIFGEVCETLYKVFSYAKFTLGLAQLVYGLAYMRLAGFVHRDISPGNCLIYEGQMKISDLEYARPYSSQGKNITPLTGTPGFMAVEYQRGRYMFQTGGKGRKANLDLYSRRTPSTLRFQFNFLHDLESVIWIYLWLLLETVPGCFTTDEEDAFRDDILRLRHKLFDGSVEGSSDRFGFIQSLTQDETICFDEAWDTLSPVYGNESALLIGLNSFLHLANCYSEVETLPRQSALPGSMNWEPTSFVYGYYAELHALFMHVHERMKGTMYRARPFRHIAVPNIVRPQKHCVDDNTQDAPNKRHRSLAVDAAYVPMVEEEEDSDRDAPPSPTANIQQRRKKNLPRRKNGRR